MDINRLISLRLKKGKSQREVAKDLDIDRTTYNKYEKGINNPTVERLEQLAAYFGVSPAYLLGVDDSKEYPYPSEQIKELAELFDKLSKEDQDAILRITKGMATKN